MTPQHLDPTTTTALAGLDPAPERPLTAAEAQRAEDLLARILEADPAPRPAPARRRSPVRWVALGGAAAAVALGTSTVLAATNPERAYATWSASPQRASTQQEVEAAAQCRESLADTGVRGVRSAPVALAERRGDVTLVVLGAGPGGAEGHCLTLDAPLGRSSTTGAVGTSGPTPGPRAVDLIGWGTAVHGDHAIGELVGRVGADVASVVVHTPDRGDVTATVAGGYLAAWWPVERRTGVPLDDVPPATVTFTDGSTAALDALTR